jgi:hypothetical protein
MEDDSSVPAKRYVRGSEPGITLAACNHRRASRRRPHRHVDVDAQVRGQVPHPPILRRGRSAITLSRGSVALRPSWTHPRIHPKLRRLTRKYRCLGGIPCAVKSLKVKVRCRLTRKRCWFDIKVLSAASVIRPGRRGPLRPCEIQVRGRLVGFERTASELQYHLISLTSAIRSWAAAGRR